MLLPAYHKGALVTPDGAQIPFVAIGDGPLPVVVIPGGSDGVATVAESAPFLAWLYRRRAQTHRLLLLSRRQPIPGGYRVEQYADDFFWAMVQLGWENAILECNSAGGPIGQHMAAQRPDRVSGLILSNTAHRIDEQARAVILHWKVLTQQRRWAEFNWSVLEHTLRPQYLPRYRLLRPLLGWLNRPRHPERLSRIFEGLLTVDNRAILPRIACPTLIVGGEDDLVFNALLQKEMAALIPRSRLSLYPGYGHINVQESPDYKLEMTTFMRAA